MKRRILIIEDQADLRQLIRMTLTLGDYDVQEADSGDSGYRMARDVSPDLILLDMTMPGTLDGLQVCQKLKSDPHYAHIPFRRQSS